MSDSALQKLLKRQRELVEELKVKNAPAYNWFLEKGIDLAKYVGNMSAAFVIVLATPSAGPVPTPAPTIISQTTTQTIDTTSLIRPEDLRGLSDQQKATLVWQKYGGFIHQTATKYYVDPNLIFATIMIESGGNTYAVRQEPRLNDASYGLGQLLYGTARGLGYTGTPIGLFDPATNIDLIGKYHRRHLDQHGGSLTAAQLTVAYNTGSLDKTPTPGHLDKFNKWYNRAENLEVNLS